MQIVKKLTGKLRIIKNQSGFTLIEAVIGTALLVIVGVAVLTGVSTAFKASATTDKISTGLAIAQSQLDYIQTQTYDPAGGYLSIDSPTRGAEQQNISPYTMQVTVLCIDANGNVSASDLGLQRITVEVRQPSSSNPVTIIGYKENRFKDT
jgi:type II secretory pathway pseudopilin PulG